MPGTTTRTGKAKHFACYLHCSRTITSQLQLVCDQEDIGVEVAEQSEIFHVEDAVADDDFEFELFSFAVLREVSHFFALWSFHILLSCLHFGWCFRG